MSLSRRNFLGSILAAGIAPAVVTSSVLMPVRKVMPAEMSFKGTDLRSGKLLGFDDDGNIKMIDQTSVWLVVWGPNSLEGLKPCLGSLHHGMG